MEKFVQPYDKEYMKMAILKHEETFKEQVYELHRLYQIQKMLMKNIQSSRQNYKQNVCFNNHQEQKNKIDMKQPVTTKDYDDQEIMDDEYEIELTLAPTSFNRKRSMSNKPESSGISSSSSGSSSFQKVERINRTNNSSSDRSLKQPPWMYQALSLNMT